MTFVRRHLQFAIKLAASSQTNQPQTFAESGSGDVTLQAGSGDAGARGGANQATLTLHRASVRVSSSGAAAGSNAQISVWGLSQSLQDQLSTLGQVLQLIPRNTMTITANDEGSPPATVFVGTILQAVPDFSGMPDVPFRFECQAGAAEAVIPFPASSYSGATQVSSILSAIAQKAGFGFENSGVDQTLPSPYLAGSAVDQIRTVAEHAHINAQIINGTLCIWPRYGSRKASGVPLIAPPPAGGMIGYPSYTQQGLLIRNVFDPRVAMGGQIKVDSSLNKAAGTWNVLKLDLALDCAIPKGKWEQTIFCYNPNFPAPIPPQAGS